LVLDLLDLLFFHLHFLETGLFLLLTEQDRLLNHLFFLVDLGLVLLLKLLRLFDRPLNHFLLFHPLQFLGNLQGFFHASISFSGGLIV